MKKQEEQNPIKIVAAENCERAIVHGAIGGEKRRRRSEKRKAFPLTQIPAAQAESWPDSAGLWPSLQDPVNTSAQRHRGACRQ
ncbi:hypothetical protein MHYP_G00095050 [Metynnis hypsauchen]